MALKWIEGFDLYGLHSAIAPTPPEEGLWAQFGLNITSQADPNGFGAPARTGTYYAANIAIPGGMRRTLGEDATTCGVGLGFWIGELPTVASFASAIVQFRDANNKCQIHLSIGPTGRLRVYRGGFDGRLVPSGTNASGAIDAMLAESTLELAPGTWNHVETKVVFDFTAGVVEVIVNGSQTFISLSGINTTSVNADTAFCSQVAFGNFGPLASNWGHAGWDDIYVYDQDGGGVHDILGEYGVYTLMPNSDDPTFHDWSLTVGSNGYALINEVPPDDDTNFIFTGTDGARSDFGVQALPANITAVAAVMPSARCRKTDTGHATMEVGVNSSTTASYSDETPITTSWTWFQPKLYEKDPHTTVAWNPLAMPEVSIKRIA